MMDIEIGPVGLILSLATYGLFVLHLIERSERKRLKEELRDERKRASSAVAPEQVSFLTIYLAGMLSAGVDERALASMLADVGDVDGVYTDTSGSGSSDYDTSNHSAM